MTRLRSVCVVLGWAWVGFSPAPVAAHEAPAATAIERASDDMRGAAVDWLATLSPSQRDQATFAFGGGEQTDWHFVPKERLGVALVDMDLTQRRAARALMESALSDKGYLKATTIMLLEQVLRGIEADRPDVDSIRHPEKYWFAVYGDPASDKGEPWGWRVEGHHVSLNFVATPESDPGDADDIAVATTPLFFGANPAEVRSGPLTGLRALGGEDDVARTLMASLTEAQRAQAIIASEAPPDVQNGPGAPPRIAGPVGVTAAELNKDQQGLLRQLVDAFIDNLRPELADETWRQIDAAGFEKLAFAWAGSLATLADSATTERHYFRVHGPTIILEYDFQEPNHVHSVWHSPTDNFGLDTLRRHHAANHE